LRFNHRYPSRETLLRRHLPGPFDTPATPCTRFSTTESTAQPDRPGEPEAGSRLVHRCLPDAPDSGSGPLFVLKLMLVMEQAEG